MKVEALCRRVTRWQTRLRLDHWDLKVAIVDEPDGKEGALASVSSSDYYDTAEIQFAADTLKRSSYDVDCTIVHELLHLHFRDLDDVVWQARKGLSQELSAAIYHRYDHEVEGVVDRLARVIVNAYNE